MPQELDRETHTERGVVHWVGEITTRRNRDSEHKWGCQEESTYMNLSLRRSVHPALDNLARIVASAAPTRSRSKLLLARRQGTAPGRPTPPAASVGANF